MSRTELKVNGIPLPDSVLSLIVDLSVWNVRKALCCVCKQLRDVCMSGHHFCEWTLELNPERFHSHYHRLAFNRVSVESHLVVVRHPLALLDPGIDDICSIPWRSFASVHIYLPNHLHMNPFPLIDTSAIGAVTVGSSDKDISSVDVVESHPLVDSTTTDPITDSMVVTDTLAVTGAVDMDPSIEVKESDDSLVVAITTDTAEIKSMSQSQSSLSKSSEKSLLKAGRRERCQCKLEADACIASYIHCELDVEKIASDDDFYVPFGDFSVLTGRVLPHFSSVIVSPVSRRRADDILWYDALFPRQLMNAKVLHFCVNGRLVHRQYFRPPTSTSQTVDSTTDTAAHSEVMSSAVTEAVDDSVVADESVTEELKTEDVLQIGDDALADDCHFQSCEIASISKSKSGGDAVDVCTAESGGVKAEDISSSAVDAATVHLAGDSVECNPSREYPGLDYFFKDRFAALRYLEFNHTSFPTVNWLDAVCRMLPNLLILDVWRCEWKPESVIKVPKSLEILRSFDNGPNMSQFELSECIASLRLLCVDPSEILVCGTIRSLPEVCAALSADSSPKSCALPSRLNVMATHLPGEVIVSCVLSLAEIGFRKVYIPQTDDLPKLFAETRESLRKERIVEEIGKMRLALALLSAEDEDDAIPGTDRSAMQSRLTDFLKLERVDIVFGKLPKTCYETSEHFNTYKRLRKMGVLRGSLRWD